MTAISPELFKRIRRIQIYTSHIVDTWLSGMYRSIFKGKGIEFEEVRAFTEGDDVRSVDWNVTARMNHPYIKIFREERELTVMLVVDVSASSRFGSVNRKKSELMAEVAAVLAFSAIKNQDKVGVILFSNEIEKYIPPKKGVRHVLRVIREVLAFEPAKKGTDITQALSFLNKVQNKATVSFLISDFMTAQDATKAVKVTAKRHDLLAIGVRDPHEVSFPPLGLLHMRDLESSEEALVDTSNQSVQEHFISSFETRDKFWRSLMRKAGSDFLELRTNEPYSAALRKYFENRGKRK